MDFIKQTVKSRKGLVFKAIHVMIILLVVIFVLILFESKIADMIKNTSDKNICKTSVYTHSKSHIKGMDFSSDIDCPTQDIVIKEKGDEAKFQLAKQMYDCWDQFGQGKLNLFNEDNMYCVICSRIDFSSDKPIENFEEYLYTHYPPGKYITYMDFLTSFETPRSEEVFGEIEHELLKTRISTEIDSSKRYSVVFVYAKGLDAMQNSVDMLSNVGTSQAVPFMIAGGVLMVAGGAITGTTYGLGSVVGVPLIITGKALWLGAGTIAIFDGYFTTDVTPEHIAYIALREYTSEELDDLGCKYMPAKQR